MKKLRTVNLPEPETAGSFPLMQALQLRRTKRKWQSMSLSDQELSNLLWSACGQTMEATTRRKSRRTVPSGHNAQAIAVYVALGNGVFQYDESRHRLIKIMEEDVRSLLSNQKMMKSAPVGLIYICDYSRLNYLGHNENQKWFVAGTETGFISQNVYLYCASANLSTVIIGLVDRKKLATIIGLNDRQQVVYTQVVGHSVG